MTKLFSKSYLLMLVVFLTMSFATPVFASDLDSLNSGQSSGSEESSQQGSGSNNDSITDYLQGYTPVTNENMSNAKQYATPITNFIGTLTGFIVVVVSAGIFAVTALDLAYIGLPFTRSWLNPEQAQNQAQGGMGMSPMGGMGYGMRGGMGMMGGGTQQPMEHGMRRRWVSDEAVACVALANPQAQGGMGMSPMGGMGMGAMGMGGMGMMGGGMQQPQQMPTKSVILMYLKKRAFFLIIFAVATIVLTSSIFTDCGINLAQLLFKVMDKVNSMISGVNI